MLLTPALLDLDRFKQIHASLGDLGGDLVLLHTARRLSEAFRGSGGSFPHRRRVVLRCCSAIPRWASRVGRRSGGRCAIRRAFPACRPQHPLRLASAGVQQTGEGYGLLQNAEQALGAAKRRGGACACVYHSDLEAPLDAWSGLESDLRLALETGQLDVFYQPIMRLSDRHVVGFEALLRWHHPQKGLVEPADFIAHCEETGLIVALGRFALERAAGDLAHWQRYFPVAPPLVVSVNLSRRQLQRLTPSRTVN